ncbi:MAG: iron-siderophore ABC transporter substrate-binding protein [Actinomycetota bacterium]
MTCLPDDKRFTHRLGAGLGALVLVLSACSPAGTQGEVEEQAAAGGPFPVTIEHQFGQIMIPSEPRRVVSIGFNDQDVLLALGVKPVAIREWFGERPFATWPWAQDALGDAKPEVLTGSELNLEAIAALRPDLIVGVFLGMEKSEYDRLSAIAPVVYHTGEHPDYGTPWQEQTRIIAKAVGMSELAEELIQQVDARFAGAREQFPQFAGRSAIVAYSFEKGAYGPYASEDLRSRALGSLGFKVPEVIDTLAGDQFYAELSNEQIEMLDTDVLAWVSLVDSSAITDLPLYRQLNAFKQGRDIFLSEELGAALSFSSVLSLPFVADQLTPRLAAAVDGDPATAVE